MFVRALLYNRAVSTILGTRVLPLGPSSRIEIFDTSQTGIVAVKLEIFQYDFEEGIARFIPRISRCPRLCNGDLVLRFNPISFDPHRASPKID